MLWLAVVLSAALLGGSSAQVANSSLGLILGKVSHGVKRGVPNVTCNAYYGVPYAEPPTGNLRFASPQPWSAQFPEPGFDATKPGNACPQLSGTDGDEDCLNLNVFTPAASRPGSDHSVMIFIHGGAFVVGSGTSPLPPIPPNVADMYDGCALASKFGVVVVTINYRLGPLGFLTTVASDGTVSSNFGMEDQREAIKWVRAHAKAFGGSGEDLTVFGQSAGAISVLHHMVSPLSKGLFTRAISESGLPMAMTADFGYQLTIAFAKKLKCPTPPGNATVILDCLRSKSVKELISQAGEVSNPFTSNEWGPVISNDQELPKHPVDLFNAGAYDRGVKLMIGHTTNEATLFVYPTNPLGILGQKGFEKFANLALNGHDPSLKLNETQMEWVYHLYSPKKLGDNRDVASRLLTDYTFTCLSQTVANAVKNTHFYRFDHRSKCLDGMTKVVMPPGVFHTAEITYVFQTPATEFCSFTPEESALSEMLGGMWTLFAQTGKPTQDPKDWPEWVPGESTHGYQSAVFGGATGQVGLSLESGYKQTECALWKQLDHSLLP